MYFLPPVLIGILWLMGDPEDDGDIYSVVDPYG